MTQTLEEPYHTLARQREADRLGMVLFLVSETLLFGGLFGAIFAIFLSHAELAAEASAKLKIWHGTINSVLLMLSSFVITLAVEAARSDRFALSRRCFGAGAVLGILFLGVKAHEYYVEYLEGTMPHVGGPHDFKTGYEQLFVNFYYVATGLHAIHLTIGIVMTGVLAFRVRSDRRVSLSAIGNIGLYWHAIDLVWIVLFAVLYLSGAR